MLTIDEVKAELDTTNSTYDDLIEVLITAVESLWDQLTNKNWFEGEVKRTFNDFYNGDIYLSGENVTRIYTVASGVQSALVITGKNENVVQTVSVGPDSVILYDRQNGETELLFTDYPTLGALAAQISATSNFSANVYTGLSEMLSIYLIEALGETCDSTGTDLYVPDEFVSGSRWDSRLKKLSISPEYLPPITVTYKCGYALSSCPGWLKQILVRQVCHWYQQAIEKRWNVSSITLGDGGTISYGEQKGNLLSDFVDMAQRHQKVNV